MAGDDPKEDLRTRIERLVKVVRLRIKSFVASARPGTERLVEAVRPRTPLGYVNLSLMAVLLLSLWFVWSRGGRIETVPATVGEGTQESRILCQTALSHAREHLKKQEFDQAYEFLLASLRLNPSDPALFAAVVDFVKATAKNASPKVEALSQDVYRRADLLVTYQSLDNLISAREQYVKLGEVFADTAVPKGSSASESAPSNDLFSDIRQSIVRSKDTSVLLSVRSRILEHARNELNALAERAAMKELEPLPGDFWTRFSTIEGSLDKAETAVLEGLFSERKKTIEDWIAGSCKKALDAARSPGPKDVPNVAEQLSQEVQAGIRHQSALAPFADSSIPGARELHLVVHDKIELLDRSKDWLYSQQALRRIAHVKQSLAMPPMEKLKYLVVIQEERLLPYIAKQFNEAWEIAFNDIKGDDDKMEALKLRVIRRNAP